jgi:choline dehydrogenase-like flavoprotein
MTSLNESFDTIVVGSGFASSFFLREYLRKASPETRVLVLEKGKKLPYSWKVKNQKSSDFDFMKAVVNLTPQKPWIQNIAFGGGSCWTGTTPRPHPSDFEMNTRYGVSEDWPFGYDELEPYLTEVEWAMAVAGTDDGPFPRSRPYPAPPHTMNSFDEVIAKKYPGEHIIMPSARATTPAAGRALCCSNGICSNCPIGAKFQVDLHMLDPYQDPRVTLLLEASVDRLGIEANQVREVYYTKDGQQRTARCDLAVVGAHAIFSPYILLRSGLDDRALGRYLHEQYSVSVQLNLDGLDSLDGSQQVTGLGVMFHDRIDRTKQATCNIETWNVPWLRAERGRWRQRALIKLIFEDLPRYENYVGVSSEDESKPELYYPRRSDYAQAGIDSAPRLVEELIDGLPVEDYVVIDEDSLGSSAHVQGTTRMGIDPDSSVVDPNMVHHKVRNLLVLGSGAFPSCPAANPTLILSALSIRAARKLMA